MVRAVSGGSRSASGSLDVQLWFAGSDEVVHAAGQLFPHLQVRLDTGSNRSTGGSVHESAVLSGLPSIFNPCRMSALVVIKFRVSNNFLRSLNDISLSPLSCGRGLSEID